MQLILHILNGTVNLSGKTEILHTHNFQTKQHFTLYYLDNMMLPVLVAFIIHYCNAYLTLRIVDYYREAESMYEWMNVVYSNDCSFFDMFIEDYLIPMNNQIINVNVTANISIESYLECDDSEANSVGLIHDTCEWWNSNCIAYQHFMFEVSKNSSNYTNIKSDSIVDSLLNRKFVHFTLLFDTNISSIMDGTTAVSDYHSYLKPIGNVSHVVMYSNSTYKMWWKLITTRMSIYLGYDIYYRVNKTQLSEQCNFIYFDYYYNYNGDDICYGFLTLDDVTHSNYTKSTQFSDANKTVELF